jgi:hypothetical protein
MKKIIIAILIILIAGAYFAAAGSITKGGHIACFTESDLNDILIFVDQKDTENGQAYLDDKRCIILQPGLNVTVLKRSGISKIQYVHKGYKFWTIPAAVTDN